MKSDLAKVTRVKVGSNRTSILKQAYSIQSQEESRLGSLKAGADSTGAGVRRVHGSGH